MRSATYDLPRLSNWLVGLQEAGAKIDAATREIARRRKPGESWVQRVIHRELENRASVRGPAYWDEVFPGMSPEARAEARIRRMLARATVARSPLWPAPRPQSCCRS